MAPIPPIPPPPAPPVRKPAKGTLSKSGRTKKKKPTSAADGGGQLTSSGGAKKNYGGAAASSSAGTGGGNTNDALAVTFEGEHGGENTVAPSSTKRSPPHHHGKAFRMRSDSVEFQMGIDNPLGAFAAKDELPTKSNRDRIRKSIVLHQHSSSAVGSDINNNNKPPSGKAVGPREKRMRKSSSKGTAAALAAMSGGDSGGGAKPDRPSMADLADIAMAGEMADLAELGKIDAGTSKSALLSSGKRRGGGGGAFSSGLGTIGDSAPVSHELDHRQGGALLPNHLDALTAKPDDDDDGRDSLRYSVGRDSMGLPERFFNRDSAAYKDNSRSLEGIDFLDALSPDGNYSNTDGTSLLGAGSGSGAGNNYSSMSEKQQQQMDIAAFASMALGGSPTPRESLRLSMTVSKDEEEDDDRRPTKVFDAPFQDEDDGSWDEDGSYYDTDEEEESVGPQTLYERIMRILDPTPYLMHDVKVDKDGVPYFEHWNGWGIAGAIRTLFFNPLSPEFSALQQFNWAVVIGIVMGAYTALWKLFIESCVDFFWETVPEFLLEHGVFTEVDGRFPLYHYMWITPAIFGGILSYIFVVLPNKIPDQNEWISNIHNRGVLDFRTFFNLFFLSTMGMASGLSLGPELPLVLTAGMFGSWLGLICKQSVLQARVMNMTAASAAVGGFFGFPMAGALFVLEIPHRMGLQYFEALSPATIASIVAVLCNRLVINNDVTGYYKYPFLTTTLPSEIFTSAIVFGLFGALVGTIYAKGTKKLKGFVHDWFHAPHDHSDHENSNDIHKVEQEEGNEAADANGEYKPLLGLTKPPVVTIKKNPSMHFIRRWRKCLCCVIPDEKYRATVAGTIAGALVGAICIFVPHVMFWGEAQLQTLIDRGRTPLPVFGIGEEPTAGLTALGLCMGDHTDSDTHKEQFNAGCSFLISTAKIVVTGISLGTGIIGGHFWGPLFTGCAASHFLVDVVRMFSAKFGFGGQLAAYPCLAILCTMGSTHVVTFRAHMAIMLILTLTISAFDPENGDHGSVAGDYSAVFPLLVVSVFVSLIITRDVVFYPTQRSRGDITAVPEVLCEPGMEGRPMVMMHEDSDRSGDTSSYGSYESDDNDGGADTNIMAEAPTINVTQSDIEREFKERVAMTGASSPVIFSTSPSQGPAPAASGVASSATSGSPSVTSAGRPPSPVISDFEKTLMESATASNIPPPGTSRRSRAASANLIFSTSPPVPAPAPLFSVPSGAEPSNMFMSELPQQSFDIGDAYGHNKTQSSLMMNSSRLDELLSRPMDGDNEHELKPLPKFEKPKRRHRRIHSAPVRNDLEPRSTSGSERDEKDLDVRFGKAPPPAVTAVMDAKTLRGVPGAMAPKSDRPSHHRTNSGMARIASYGEVKVYQPSLLDQARSHAATAAKEYLHRRVDSYSSERPGHSRTNSGRLSSASGDESSVGGYGSASGVGHPSRRRHHRKNSEPLAVNSSDPIVAGSGMALSGIDNKPGGSKAFSRRRHMRKSSDPFGGAMPRPTPPRRPSPPPSSSRGIDGALPLDDIESAFDSVLRPGGAY